jgi:hypothetical protein
VVQEDAPDTRGGGGQIGERPLREAGEGHGEPCVPAGQVQRHASSRRVHRCPWMTDDRRAPVGRTAEGCSIEWTKARVACRRVGVCVCVCVWTAAGGEGGGGCASTRAYPHPSTPMMMSTVHANRSTSVCGVMSPNPTSPTIDTTKYTDVPYLPQRAVPGDHLPALRPWYLVSHAAWYFGRNGIPTDPVWPNPQRVSNSRECRPHQSIRSCERLDSTSHSCGSEPTSRPSARAPCAEYSW